MKPPHILNQTEKYYTAIHDKDTFYKINLFTEDLYRKKSFAMQKTKKLNKCYRVYKENDTLGIKLFIKSLKKETIKDPFLRDFIEKMEKGTIDIVSQKTWFTLDLNY